MRKVILIAAVAALAACSKPATNTDETATPAATDTAAAAPAPAATTMAADGKPSTGTFKVTSPDGQVVMEEVRADGTYADTVDGKVVETGRWEQKSSAQYCWTKDGPGEQQICSDEKVENGKWTSYNPVTKKTATIERVEG
ncbi:hypothetical protein GCM10011515_17530 [Tsuneonella deserti]|uniref:Lipoprotein n=1 Tax=Tsuneonella deserti TaxID=2035528 RepID=A0ABQ1S7Q3_9SPHN|nr:hypothetical protein [Tsuneonella deserti]GGD98223.1 hypothetical protein GCM10011515_17530 [Tsuneonella deserti]